MNAFEAMARRISANKFDPSTSLSEDDIRELVGHATTAPSAFNIQHWRFVAITKKEDKERLKAVAYGQQKIADAAVTFIVLGDLRGAEKLPEILAHSVASGVIDQAAADAWVKMTSGTTPEAAHDEALRSASLASMSLMIAAEAKGLASCPMIGFDGAAVKKEFGISDRYAIAMLIAVGNAAQGNSPKKYRLPVDEVLAFDRARDF